MYTGKSIFQLPSNQGCVKYLRFGEIIEVWMQDGIEFAVIGPAQIVFRNDRSRDDEINQLRLEAARYRWMRDHGRPGMESWFQELRDGEITADEADKQIDEEIIYTASKNPA